jgi:hypothetical protein
MSAALTVDDVARALRIEVGDLMRRLPYLRRRGFPRHLPGLGLRWSERQVTAWIDAGGVAESPPEPAGPSGLRLVIDNARAALHEKYVRAGR